ncbi:MAG: zinc dependent phospholipase C family protein [Planctomycetota bacterium]|mgnify:CR=1 FL=1
MGNRRNIFIGFTAAVIAVGVATDALAWGPATHVKFASDLLGNLWLLPAALGALLSRHPRYFIYGNVATDTVLAKKMSRVKQVCHRWATGFSLFDAAQTDEGRAFAYGYLSHLAADTVAHNKFLPRQMAVCHSTITFGHIYWEIRADAVIERPYWDGLRDALRGRYPEPERLLRSQLTETMLSYRTNRIIFKRVNLLASLSAWRRSVEFWSKLSRFPLDGEIVQTYHDESMSRMVDVIEHGRASIVLHEDPNGNSAMSFARAQRRQIRQMRRAGISHVHVVEEAAAGHAANPKRLPVRALE